MDFGKMVFYLLHIRVAHALYLSSVEQEALSYAIKSLAPLMTTEEAAICLFNKSFATFLPS